MGGAAIETLVAMKSRPKGPGRGSVVDIQAGGLELNLCFRWRWRATGTVRRVTGTHLHIPGLPECAKSDQVFGGAFPFIAGALSCNLDETWIPRRRAERARLGSGEDRRAASATTKLRLSEARDWVGEMNAGKRRERSEFADTADPIESASWVQRQLARALSLVHFSSENTKDTKIVLPLARAVGALYLVETESSQAAEAAITARDCMRTTLASLQDAGPSYHAQEELTKLIARCLGVTHQLAEYLAEVSSQDLAHTRPVHPTPPPGPAHSPEEAAGHGAAARSVDTDVDAVPQTTKANKDSARKLDRNVDRKVDRQLDDGREPEDAREPDTSRVAAAPSSDGPFPESEAETSRRERGVWHSSPPESEDDEQPVSPTRPSETAKESRAFAKTRLSHSHDEASPRGVGKPHMSAGPRPEDTPSRVEARRRYGKTMESRKSGGPSSKRARGPDTLPPANAVMLEANLGAHSPTNLYKGLSGNDIVDHGGIFVASYRVLEVGTPLWLKVTLPGGYDFEATARVSWIREVSTPDAPPGFGATFEKLSADARNLLQRFANNREPLFHDEM